MSKPDLSTYGGRLRDLGYAGEIVDTNPVISQSLTNDQTIAVDFGVAVARSAADGTCKAPAADADKIIGISIRHAIRPASTDGNNTVNYAKNDSVPILKDGFIYVLAYENTNRGDGVISVTAQNGKLGSTTGGAAGAGRVVVPGATWETSTTAGQIGIVRIAY
jgi:hypothetical protein